MAARRTIWILKHARAGDLAQMRHLLHLLRESDPATDWPEAEKQLVFQSDPGFAPGRAGRALDWAASGLSGQPWPDAILATEKIATWIGADIKRRSGGRSRLIVLGRMAGDDSVCDLVLATPQFPQRTAKTVMLPVPLAPAPKASPETRVALQQQMAGRARPWTLWAVGGSVAPDKLDAAAIASLCAATGSEAGTAMVFASPRTGEVNAEALRKHLPAGAYLQEWTGSGPNLFPAALAEADRIVVTSDSISMAAEATDAGKPVALYRLPQTETAAVRFGRALAAGGASARLLAPLLRRGIIETPPDRTAFFRELINSGWLGAWPDFSSPSGARPLANAERLAVDAVRKLLA